MYKQLLTYALENGILNTAALEEEIMKHERQCYLNKHVYEIWQGTNEYWYTYLPSDGPFGSRKLIKRKNRTDLENKIVQFYRDLEQSPTFTAVFYEWLQHKVKFGEIMQQTYDRYEVLFKQLLLESLGSMKIENITEEILENYIRTTIRDNELTAKTWGNLRTLINGVFKYAKKCKYTSISISSFLGDLDISSKCFRKVVKKDEESVFTDNEVKMITSWIFSRPLSIINLGILLAFQVGVRVGELSALQPQDVDGNILHITKTEERYRDPVDRHIIYEVRNHPKTAAGIRDIVIPQSGLQILHLIEQMNPRGEYLFMRNGERVKGKAFTCKLRRICKKLHIPERSMHKCRCTYITKLLDSHVPEMIILRQAGHAQISTSKTHYYYNRNSQATVEEAVQKAIKY